MVAFVFHWAWFELRKRLKMDLNRMVRVFKDQLQTIVFLSEQVTLRLTLARTGRGNCRLNS